MGALVGLFVGFFVVGNIVVGLGLGLIVGQMAQYGPTVTGMGSKVLVHAVFSKMFVRTAPRGSQFLQVQRSWLNDTAFSNMDCNLLKFVAFHCDKS